MNKILINTHKKESIDLLIIRDYYFEIARKLSQLNTVIVLAPSVLLAVLIVSNKHENFVWSNLTINTDIFVGCITIVAWFLSIKCKVVVNKYLDISNCFREKYDEEVLGIEKEPYLFTFDDNYLKKLGDKVLNRKCVKDNLKYDSWYGERFIGDSVKNSEIKNKMLCQIDNLIYSKYIYIDHNRLFTIILIIIVILFFINVYRLNDMDKIILLLLTISQIFLELSSYVVSTKDKEQELEEILGKIKGLNTEVEIEQFNIRALQNVVFEVRRHTTIVPKFIRLFNLREDSVYKNELNEYRKKLANISNTVLEENSFEIASNAYDFVSVSTKDVISFSDVQSELLKMLKISTDILNENNIPYVLDGGTLIGNMRPKNKNANNLEYGFIPWDDDVDLAIPFDLIEKAEKALIKGFENQSNYGIQTYIERDNGDSFDKWYSPRLSNFRIRNNNFKTYENDSMLFKEYNQRGLFIDVYGYQVSIKPLFLDKLFRYVCVHPLNIRLKRAENKVIFNQDKRSYDKLRVKYINRLNWYTKLTKNSKSKYYSYSPNYISNYKKAGPYFEKDWLYTNEMKFGIISPNAFESYKFQIPVNADAVLKEMYGDYTSIPDGNKSVGKHIRWVDKQ
ncbi:MAG: S-4TM family putative pore-forming effector [Erysipelotrichaceae bacterium]